MLSVLKTASHQALAEIQEEMKIRWTTEVFLLFAMGSQFDHLIVQALAKLGVYCLPADPASVTAADVKAVKPIGIIISGGPASVHSEPPPFDNEIFDLGIPILGICLGFQMWAKHAGLIVSSGTKKEFGIHRMQITAPSKLFANCPPFIKVLQSHGDEVLPDEMTEVIAVSQNAIAAARHKSKDIFGVQFHPEVSDTGHGQKMFENFCFRICGAKITFPAKGIAESKISKLQDRIGNKKVLLALSGGSDSSVVAYLLKKVMGHDKLRAVYIRGIDRPDDEGFTSEFFGDMLNLVMIDGTERFLEVLAGKKTMHEKRLAMRGVYKGILEDEIRKFGADFIAQGTLYTDICESGGGIESGARKAQIKLHHNTNLGFSVPEITPLDNCVKDGARNIGREIGVPEVLLLRHPFPGPGLVVRIEGEITAEKLAMAREIDGIWISELRNFGFYQKVWQAGATVTVSQHTCTKGDDAGFGPVVVLWAVTSVNGFTAQPARFPHDFLEHVSRRISNEVPGVGAVAYRLSGKPPTTIEWG